MLDANTAQPKSLMDGFAERTGLISGSQRRYLWTDAFAVCNLLGLRQATGLRNYDDLARRLVDGVHHVLGRHRDDAPLTGWLSSLEDNAGEVHPTVAGLYDTFFPGAPEVRETFQYFGQCTYFGPESGPRIAAAKAVYGAEFIGFSDWAKLNLAPTTGELMNA